MSSRKTITQNLSELPIIGKPAEMSTYNDTRQKDASDCLGGLAVKRWSDVPVIVEVNMIPNPTLDEKPVAGQKAETAEALPFCKRYMGILFGLLASMVFSMSSMLVKILAARYHPVNLGFWRFQGVMLPGIVIIAYQQIFVEKSNIFESVLPLSDPGKKKTAFLVLMRAVLGCTALLFQYYAITLIGVADSSVICFSSPIVITVLAYFILHEAFSIVQFLFSFVTLLGVIIIARPPFLTGSEEFDFDTLLGTGMALGTMCFSTFVFMLLRFLRESHYLLITVVFGIWGSFQCIVIALILDVFQLPQNLTDWSLGISLALLTFLGQTMMTLACKYEQSGIIALLRCLDVVFAFIFQFIFLGVHPDLYSLAGASLVVLSVAIIGFRKWVLELPEDHQTRKILRIILH